MQHQLFCQDGSSNKFWNLATDEARMTVHYGRVGTAGQRQEKTFASAAACEKEANKLLAEKRRKGYQELAADEAVPEKLPDLPNPLVAQLDYYLRAGLLTQAAILARVKAEALAGEVPNEAGFDLPGFVSRQATAPGGLDAWLAQEFETRLTLQRERERQYAPRTDFERLGRGLATVAAEGIAVIYTHVNYYAPNSIDWPALAGPAAVGYCVCDAPQTDHFCKSHHLTLHVEALPQRSDPAQQLAASHELCRRVVAALQAQGLAATHNEDYGSSVTVYHLRWQKRYDGLDWTASPPPTPAPPVPELRRERLAGRRVRLLAGCHASLLGTVAEAAALLESYGATVLDPTTVEDEFFDFYLSSHAFTIPYHGWWARRPVMFEEELLTEPLAPASALLPNLRPQLLEMLRQLLFHPRIQVSYFWLGLPLDDDGLTAAAARLNGQPLPAGLRELYQQVNLLQLLWLYRVPVRPVKVDDPSNNQDEIHDGSIEIDTLDNLLSDNWDPEDYGFGLTKGQWIFDKFSEYYMMGIEVGKRADPLLLLGNDYGASFEDNLLIQLSDYLALVRATYGDQDRVKYIGKPAGGYGNFRNEPPTLLGLAQRTPLAFYPNPLGYELGVKEEYSYSGDGPVLQGPADRAELHRLLEAYAAAGLPGHYFELLEWALTQPAYALADYEAAAVTRRYHDTPRFQQLRKRFTLVS